MTLLNLPITPLVIEITLVVFEIKGASDAPFLLAGAMCVPANAFAQTSAEYAVMAKQAWANLDCAALANFADDTNEYRRLFTLGIRKGRTFWEASDKGKIEQQDYNREVPSGVSMAFPDYDDVVGADFVFGRLFERAMQDAHNLTYDTK